MDEELNKDIENIKTQTKKGIKEYFPFIISILLLMLLSLFLLLYIGNDQDKIKTYYDDFINTNCVCKQGQGLGQLYNGTLNYKPIDIKPVDVNQIVNINTTIQGGDLNAT